MTRLLSPVISASFCSVWASGLLSWANWDCITYEDTPPWVMNPHTYTDAMKQHVTHTHTHTHTHVRAASTCSCSAVNDVRALLAGFGWQSWSEGSAPSRLSPVPLRTVATGLIRPLHPKIDILWSNTKQCSFEFTGQSCHSSSLCHKIERLSKQPVEHN